MISKINIFILLTCLIFRQDTFNKHDFNHKVIHRKYVENVKPIHIQYVVLELSGKRRNMEMRAKNGNIFKTQVSVFHQNIEGKKNAKDIITATETLISKLQPDILFISEADTEILTAWDFPGYKTYKGSLPGADLVRLTAIVRRSLPHEITYLQCEVPHAVVNFKIENKQYRCTGIYREWNFSGRKSTKQEQEIRWAVFEDAWLVNNRRCKNSMLLGDINFCYLNSGNTTHQQSLEPIRSSVMDNIVLAGWTQLITKTTRHRGTQEPSCLDHVYYNNPSQIKYSLNKVYTEGDHNCTGAVIKTRRYIPVAEEFISRCWASVNWNWGRYLVRYSSLFYKVFSFTDPNDILDFIEVELRNIMDTIAPEKLVKLKAGQQKWMTRHIREWLEYRDKLKELWHKSGLRSDERKWREVKTEVRFMIRRAKEAQVVKELEVKDLKKRWKRIKTITGDDSGDSGPPTELLENGVTYKDPVDIANILSKGFREKVSGIMERVKADPEKAMILFEDYAKKKEERRKFGTFDFQEVDCYEVRKACMSLNNTPSLGTDKIPTIVIKQLSRELAPYLAYLINQIIRTNIFPDRWRQGEITPIHKGGLRNVKTNFRPVTITNSLSKVFERLADNQMTIYFWRYNIIDASQHAYQERKGCSTYWMDLVTKICMAKDNKKKASLMVYDLSAAFNLIQIDIMKPKLLRVGFTEKAANLLAETMLRRKLKVKIDGKYSEEEEVSTGSAEGGILSPGVFNFCLCDIASVKDRVQEAAARGIKTEAAMLALKEGKEESDPVTQEKIVIPNLQSEGGGYADDNGWVNMTDTEEQLRAAAFELDAQVMEYFQVQGMAANAKKTEILDLANRFTRPITVGEVSSQEIIKLLGVRMDRKLSFMAQAREVVKKVSNKLPSVVKLRGWASKEVLIRTADSLLLSHFRYLIEIWGGETRVQSLLQKCQNKVMRALLGKHITDRVPVASMLQELEWNNIPIEVAYRSVFWLRKVDRGACAQYTWRLLDCGQSTHHTRHWRVKVPFISQTHATSTMWIHRALHWYNKLDCFPDCSEEEEFLDSVLSRITDTLGNGNF